MLLRIALLAAAIATTASPAIAKFAPSQLITFGDSLVDPGNLDALVHSDMYNPASKGYFQGRFTNGPDYTDLLSQKLYGHYQVPAFAGTGGTNYAIGGARVVDTGDLVPDLGFQLGTYLGSHPADPNALYVINAGGNDVYGLIAGSIGGYASADAYATAVVTTLTGAVQTLDAAGARHILVTGIPNVAPNEPLLDQQLQSALTAIQPGLQGDLLRFSYLDFFAKLQADPAALGVPAFTQTGACFDHRTPASDGSIDCSGFTTVDGIHPIAPIQAAIFREIVQVAGVPEPSSWAFMIGGFGLVGLAVRRRSNVAA